MRMTQKSVPFGIRQGQAVLILAITVQRRDVRRPVLNPLHKQKNAQREIPCAFVVKEVMMLLWKELFCTRNAFKLFVVCCLLFVAPRTMIRLSGALTANERKDKDGAANAFCDLIQASIL